MKIKFAILLSIVLLFIFIIPASANFGLNILGEQIAVVEVGQIVSDRGVTIEVPPAHLAGWYKYSAPPGMAGNTVVLGHDYGVMGILYYLQIGDMVEFGGYSYQISHIYTVSPGDASSVQPTNDTRLTMFTCYGEQRLIVVGFLVR